MMKCSEPILQFASRQRPAKQDFFACMRSNSRVLEYCDFCERLATILTLVYLSRCDAGQERKRSGTFILPLPVCVTTNPQPCWPLFDRSHVCSRLACCSSPPLRFVVLKMKSQAGGQSGKGIGGGGSKGSKSQLRLIETKTKPTSKRIAASVLHTRHHHTPHTQTGIGCLSRTQMCRLLILQDWSWEQK